ncbi:MAG: hypothetical protein OXG98_09955 [Gemmatimonadetes bacterium]|nr:hypothetical protein [Gemmatimonadota bacterium]
MISIPVEFVHDASRRPMRWPVTRGVPIPEGLLLATDGLGIVRPDGARIPTQCRVLGRWPDGSVKWALVDFQADPVSSGRAVYTLTGKTTGEASNLPAPPPVRTVRIEETDQDLHVDTGALCFRISRRRYGLFHSVSLVHATHGTTARAHPSPGQDGDAWARIREGASDGELKRRLYGPGGMCRASLAEDSYTVTVEEQGPLRVVIRMESALEADIPMHHYAGYRPVRCITRIHAYAGHAFVRILQTHVFTCNPREAEIEDLALNVPAICVAPEAGSGSGLGYAFGLNGVEAGTLEVDELLKIAQKRDNAVQISRVGPGVETGVAAGEACEGWATLEDGISGVGVACRNMAEEHPRAIEVAGDGRITVYARHDPDGSRLSLARYAEEVAWHEGEGAYADGTGIAKTTEFFVHYFEGEQRDNAIESLRCALSQPHLSVSPEWMARCEVAGGFAVPTCLEAGDQDGPAAADAGGQADTVTEKNQEVAASLEILPAADRMLTGFADWIARNIRIGRWYGFLDYGDVLVDWDDEENDWKHRGRWGWCNSEWDPRHAVWIQYLRTGDPRYYVLAEAMTRHSMDVDTCHWHPFRPYMAGGCYRHGVDHFSDEPCASHTFIDNWMDYYYLTGDGRALEVLREAGAFFLRYRWTEDPAFSFSLRSIANVLRGLLYVYEATGEDRFLRRAEEVYTVVARGQNEDGSWHKRFQVSTPDRLPEQLPYGMATEGTTLAVETGTAAPFTDDEFNTLGGSFSRMIRDLPYEEQKGYQTHYLMIGLELMHRMTGRSDVAETYRRGVDWFCGFPDTFSSDRPLQEHYGGILCRHLGYAHRLTGDDCYIKTGLKILELLIDSQDWSDDPRKRGSIGMSPMHLSLLLFGVPSFLAVLRTD